MSGGCPRLLALGGWAEYVGAEVVPTDPPLGVCLDPLREVDRDASPLNLDVADHPKGDAKPLCRFGSATYVGDVLLEDLICVHAVKLHEVGRPVNT